MANESLDKLFKDLPSVLTPEEVSGLLRMNKMAIYRWLNDEYLPGHKIGNNWRILRDDLYVWLEKSKRGGGTDT